MGLCLKLRHDTMLHLTTERGEEVYVTFSEFRAGSFRARIIAPQSVTIRRLEPHGRPGRPEPGRDRSRS